MKVITISTEGWNSWKSLYDDLFNAAGAPSMHGYSIDAIVDIFIWHSDLCRERPPYTITVTGTSRLSDDFMSELKLIKESISSAREEHIVAEGRDVVVTLEIFP